MKPAGENTVAHPSLTRAEIDLTALAHNYRELRRITAPAADIMAVVKADGYGHGALRVARVALDCGARFLAVARLDEAVRLRQAGIDAPILLFGYSFLTDVACMAENNIRASINSSESARMLSAEAVRTGKILKVHIKIDTGMGRLGLLADRLTVDPDAGGQVTGAVKEVLTILSLPSIEVEGIFTHFANADAKDKAHARDQFNRFTVLLEDLDKEGFRVQFRHAANSAATIEMPETHLDLVRPGVSQYGLWPSDEVDKTLIDLRPVMTIKSTVIQVKSVGSNFAVSYGSTHHTSRPTRIATVPIGYADGFDRILSSKGHMLVKGARAPIIGQVCMDLTMIDVGHIPDVALEDEVVIMGRQGDEEITADEIAGHVGTINYEIVSSLTSRVPKIYIE
ncbi:MAG: alanine racemase [Thermodesulfobacteriota bacterium]|nr:alanine racemase [Thermodesulfobacteriota bacterium]